MTIKKWDQQQKDRPLSINPGFKGNVTQKRITTSFSLFGKKILLMIISQIFFCLQTERQKFNNTVNGHHSVLLIEKLSYLEQAYHFHAQCLLCFELLQMELSRMRRPLLEQTLQIVNRSEKLLDQRILGLLTNTIGDLLLSHVIYD